MASNTIQINSPVQEVEFDVKNVNRFLHPVRIMIAGENNIISIIMI
jgi:hypothetical protein